MDGSNDFQCVAVIGYFLELHFRPRILSYLGNDFGTVAFRNSTTNIMYSLFLTREDQLSIMDPKFNGSWCCE